MKGWLKKQLEKKWGFRIIMGVLILIPLLCVVWFFKGDIPNIFGMFFNLFKKKPVLKPSAKDSVSVHKNPEGTDILPSTPELDKTLNEIDKDLG